MLQIIVYKRTEVEGRDFVAEIHLYLENQYRRQVRIFFSIECNYKMEYLI